MHPSILEIFKTIIQKEKNVLLSPFCFEIIINLISQGTTGESQKELLGLLKTSNSDEEYVKLIEVLEKIKVISKPSKHPPFLRAHCAHHGARGALKTQGGGPRVV